MSLIASTVRGFSWMCWCWPLRGTFSASSNRLPSLKTAVRYWVDRTQNLFGDLSLPSISQRQQSKNHWWMYRCQLSIQAGCCLTNAAAFKTKRGKLKCQNSLSASPVSWHGNKLDLDGASAFRPLSPPFSPLCSFLASNFNFCLMFIKCSWYGDSVAALEPSAPRIQCFHYRGLKGCRLQLLRCLLSTSLKTADICYPIVCNKHTP